ncbi:restriction endonuclease subunit S [Sporosarcina sp. P33]|uniref:restriction endonuclease subunit S n=1 Tax=Sporosarcina sp. P33 TaxID=1930764 RepID=UPI0018C8CC3E|nr:restriction endonuclease subunit S [Sporosarcina sp. P33]
MKNKNIPNIRFPEFNDTWGLRKLGELTERVRGNDGRMNLPTLTISAASGWLDQRERFSANIAGKEQKNYTLLSKGELSYNKGNSKLAKYGVVYELKNYDEALVPRVYHSFRVNKYSLASFIEYMFETKKTDKELAKLISSGARMDGLLNIGYEEFMGIKIKVPSIMEQEKIVNLIRSFNNVISLQQQELTILKQTKQGFLQKMFPKEGEAVPEVRFPGFTEDWVQHRFEKVFDVHTDFVSNGSFQDLKDNVKLYHTENYAYMIRLTDASNNWKGPWLYTDQKGFEFLDKSTVYENDILMSDRGTIGKFFLVPELGKPMTLSSNAVLLRSSKNDNSFTYYLLNTKEVENQIKMRTTPGAQPMISKTEFKQITAKFPRLNEQKKIGSFFKQLDDTIILHQRELEALQQTKKAFLQKMFV